MSPLSPPLLLAALLLAAPPSQAQAPPEAESNTSENHQASQDDSLLPRKDSADESVPKLPEEVDEVELGPGGMLFTAGDALTDYLAQQIESLEATIGPSLLVIEQGPFGPAPVTGLLVAPDRVVSSSVTLPWGTWVNVTDTLGHRVQGAVVAVDSSLGLSLVRMSEPLPNAQPATLSDGLAAYITGYDIPAGFGSPMTLHSVAARVEQVGDSYSRVLDLLPPSFEGAVAVSAEGLALGVVVGSSQAGSPLLRGRKSIETLLSQPEEDPPSPEVTVEAPAKPVSWSLGAMMGYAVPHRPPAAPAYGVRLELLIKQRFSIGALAWTSNTWTDRPGNDPSRFTLVPGRFSKNVVLGLMEPILGKPKPVALGLVFGAGALNTTQSLPHVYAQFGASCNPQGSPCEITATEVLMETLSTTTVGIALGLDLLSFEAEGPLGSSTGFRFGYLVVMGLDDLQAAGQSGAGIPGSTTHLFHLDIQL